MNAAELLAALRALPSARKAAAQAPVAEALVLAGVEVAHAPISDDRAFRRAWRDRQGGGATPLLLVADDPGKTGCIRVLGPQDGTGPIRTVEPAALQTTLTRVAALPRLQAVRELAGELDRLDQAGIPGVRLRDLLTLHSVGVRLRDRPEWGRLQEAIKSLPHDGGWREIADALGYEVEQLRHRGYLLRFDGAPVAVVHPKADPAEFSRLSHDGRPPEGLLLEDCRHENARYGLLVAGSRFRLFDATPDLGGSAARYLELDASVLQPDDRPLLGLLAPAFLAEGGLEELQEDARRFGAALRERIDETIRQHVLPVLARALGGYAEEHGQDVEDEAVRAELEAAALTLVFRLLFLLYAESARYLPVDHPAYHSRSLTKLVEDAARLDLDPKSTSLWDGFTSLVRAMRTGDTARAVPAYNGALFAPDGFEGAKVLERLEIGDFDFGSMLTGLALDPETGSGVDYSTLEIGHLGHIYEGLLSLRLAVADRPLRYDAKSDTYLRVKKGEDATVGEGDLLWQTHEGGRKSGGVFYTRAELVRHLVRQAVVPTFEDHLTTVRARAAKDPAAAAAELFDFAVLDPACGSAHFLVVVVDEMADMVVRFLAETPLPALTDALERLKTGAAPGGVIDDVALLRRLLLKRCVFGVDVSPMGAEVAKLSLWLTSFVPGLSLAYLDRNVQVGNSLLGVAKRESVLPRDAATKGSVLGHLLEEAVERAAEAARRVAESDDRTPDEIEASKAADAEARAAAEGLCNVFNLWTAEPFGLKGARQEAELHGADIIAGRTSDLVEAAGRVADDRRFLHWLPAFPTVFARERPGFDAIVSNPPWEQVMVKENAFYVLFRPGLLSLPERERHAAVAELVAERPDLAARLEGEQQRTEIERAYLSNSEYEPMPGHPDLYKFFCQRYGHLLREGGKLGVVLPRSAFVTEGSAGFRAWLFERNRCERLDFLLNKGRWAFDVEPRYTMSLVAARHEMPRTGDVVKVAATAESLSQWESQAASPGITLAPEAFGPGWAVPLLRTQAEADLLAALRHGSRFPHGSCDGWRCFAIQELNETFDRRLWDGARSGWPLWKGESFDQYDPHGAEARVCPTSKDVRKKVEKPRPGAGSLLSADFSVDERRKAVLGEIARVRVAFRDVSRATDSRTVRACLIPPETFLTNKAPYLAFATGGDRERACCLGIMNSLVFDWQARRFVETNLNFFILEGLVVPDLSDDDFDAIAEAAARLSCVDERFANFAESVGVEHGPLSDDERNRLRIEIDARVAAAWGLSPDHLETLLADFTTDAVPVEYRERLRARQSEFS